MSFSLSIGEGFSPANFSLILKENHLFLAEVPFFIVVFWIRTYNLIFIIGKISESFSVSELPSL